MRAAPPRVTMRSWRKRPIERRDVMGRKLTRGASIAALACLILGSAVPAVAAGTHVSVGPGPVRHVTIVRAGDPGATFYDGSVLISWEAPLTRGANSRIATAYQIRCGSQVVTTRRLAVRFTSVTDAQRDITCVVTALHNKVLGASVRTSKIVTYHAYGASVLQYDPALAATFANRISASTPAIAAAHGFALPMVTNLGGLPAVLRHEGGIAVGPLKLVRFALVDDPAGTPDAPVEDLVGVDSVTGLRVTLLVARAYQTDSQTFTAHAPSDAASLQWLSAAGMSLTPDQPIGTYRLVPLG